MKKDIILAGVGGQGILSIATVLGEAALTNGLHIKQAELHGMSQRCGDSHTNLRISSEPIHSDLIPFGKVDMIMSLEPMEALRYVQELSKDGWIVTSSVPFVNIPDYPDKEEIYEHLKAMPHTVMLDVEALAKEAGAPSQAANMVLLGAAIPMLDLSYEAVRDAVAKVFSRKGKDIVDKNLAALEAGYRHSSEK